MTPADIIDHMATLEWFAAPPAAPAPAAPVVREPRHVRKVGGSFQHTGTVVAEFKTLAGEPRIVLEFDAPVAGMLHVYRPDQVEPCEPAAPAQPAVPLMTQATSDVLAERKRQVEVEGWTAEHDSQHRDGSMALAAAVYALIGSSDGRTRGDNGQTPSITEILWPWDWSWFKPKSRRHNLIRAAALLLAEIERLDRAHGITRGKP